MPKESQKKMEEKWYHWGRWVTNTLFHSIWFKFNLTQVVKNYPVFELEKFKVLDGHYYFLKSDLDRITAFIENKFTDDNEWFEEFFNRCDKKVEKLNSLLVNRVKIHQFFNEFVECLAHSMAIELIDFAAQQYIKKIALAYNVSADEIFHSIMPNRNTLLMQFSKKSVAGIKTEDLIKEYKWVGTHGFEGEPLSKEKIKQFIVNGHILPKAYQKLDSRFVNIIMIGSSLVFYRSYIVETGDKVSYSYWNDMQKLGERNSISWSDIRYLTVDELISLEKNVSLAINIKERKNKFGIVAEGNKMFVVTGEDLIREQEECDKKENIENIKELRGQTAFRGVVQGIVRVIQNANEISKLKKGEILVANETTPDFIFAMRKASAIITSIGGITSHAAIISRELKIPCIIGTKIATKVLHDGDLVEVDADKGVVRILERAKSKN